VVGLVYFFNFGKKNLATPFKSGFSDLWRSLKEESFSLQHSIYYSFSCGVFRDEMEGLNGRPYLLVVPLSGLIVYDLN
jgi:hypothetical protein